MEANLKIVKKENLGDEYAPKNLGLSFMQILCID